MQVKARLDNFGSSCLKTKVKSRVIIVLVVSCCWDKITQQNSLRKEGMVYSGSKFEATTRKSQQQERDVAGPSASTVRKQTAIGLLAFSLHSPFSPAF